MTVLRNLELGEFIAHLETLEGQKKDLVVPSSKLSMEENHLLIKGTANDDRAANCLSFAPLFADLAIETNLLTERAALNKHFHWQLANKMGINWDYYQRCQEQNPALVDANVNGWLRHENENRKFLVRMYQQEEGMLGRAFLSNGYKCIDNLQILYTALEEIQRQGLDLMVESCDLTEKKMYVRFVAPGVMVSAKELLKSYKNPDTLEVGEGIIAGFTLRNSEVGAAAFEIAPRAVVLVCGNGMISEQDVQRKVHVGTKLDEGEIDWSNKTHSLNKDLIQSQIADYVRHFTSKEYLSNFVNRVEKYGQVKLNNPIDVVENVSEHFKLNQTQKKGILDYFVKSGQMTGFGVSQAMTFYAHQQDNPDVRNQLEGQAIAVLKDIPKFDYQARKN